MQGTHRVGQQEQRHSKEVRKASMALAVPSETVAVILT